MIILVAVAERKKNTSIKYVKISDQLTPVSPTPPFLRIALRVAVAMDFHIAQNRFISRNIFSHLGYHREQFGTNEKLSLWCKLCHNRSRGCIVGMI